MHGMIDKNRSCAHVMENQIHLAFLKQEVDVSCKTLLKFLSPPIHTVNTVYGS